MKDSKLFKSPVATFVIIVFGGPSLVLANTPSYLDFVEDVKVAVSYADLNLEYEESARVLYSRRGLGKCRGSSARQLRIRSRNSPPASGYALCRNTSRIRW